MNNIREELFGTLTLENAVDITDPCYDKDVWCRMTAECKPGEYEGIAAMQDCGVWGIRVRSLSIRHTDLKNTPIDEIDMKPIGDIGVDAGLAGFFNNKPDFNDTEWFAFCDEIKEGKYWNLHDGIFSRSGYGDGCYEVYTSKDNDAFTILFIDEDEE